MREIVAFQCGFCHRCFARKVNALSHEAACKHNPARHACVTCTHHMIKEQEVGSGFCNVQWCAHYDRPLYDKPYFAECDEASGSREYRPIPGTCQEYKTRNNKEATT